MSICCKEYTRSSLLELVFHYICRPYLPSVVIWISMTCFLSNKTSTSSREALYNSASEHATSNKSIYTELARRQEEKQVTVIWGNPSNMMEFIKIRFLKCIEPVKCYNLSMHWFWLKLFCLLYMSLFIKNKCFFIVIIFIITKMKINNILCILHLADGN